MVTVTGGMASVCGHRCEMELGGVGLGLGVGLDVALGAIETMLEIEASRSTNEIFVVMGWLAFFLLLPEGCVEAGAGLVCENFMGARSARSHDRPTGG